MTNYNIYLNEENEKYNFIRLAREAGAVISGVSGCGTGYYIQLQATDEQAARINSALEAGA